MRRLTSSLLTLLVLLALLACSSGASQSPSAQPASQELGAQVESPRTAGDAPMTDPMTAPEPGAPKGDAGAGAPGMDTRAEETASLSHPVAKAASASSPADALRDMPALPAMMPSGAPGPIDSADSPRHNQARSDLKAGEVDDNQQWEEYLDFVEDYPGPHVRRTDLSDRHIITVLDQNGNPVPNAQVEATVVTSHTRTQHSLRTYADGRTMLFLHTDTEQDTTMTAPGNPAEERPEITLTAARDGFTSTLLVPQDSRDRDHRIVLEGTIRHEDHVPLDIAFLLDSTGSMADEINRIKETLLSIAQQVSNLPSQPDLRFGMVSYRDREDDYVTRIYDFDPDVQRFSRTIEHVQAEGGGDYPESLNQALHEAVNDLEWRDQAVRIIFLVADAPPHLDYPQDEDYAVDMVQARRQAIKTHVVASSGLDQQGEYIFRQIAQQTLGKFIFILYQAGPQGELTTPHDVDQFTVDRLDTLIVRLIQEELAALNQTAQEDSQPGTN